MSKTNYRITKDALVYELKKRGANLVHGWKLLCQNPGCEWFAYVDELSENIALDQCPSCRETTSDTIGRPVVECLRSQWLVLTPEEVER